MAVAVVLVATGLGLFVAVRAQISGIKHIKRIDTAHSPPKYTNALNILLLGSDTRTNQGGVGGRAGCNCSDTIMVAHISPGHKRVIVVSIPRDTVVPLYACSPWEGLPGQQADPYAAERINATLANGGPECVRETVEQQTGIFIDYVIELNFTGFEKVINDIGGVNVCLPFAIDNPVTSTEGSGLKLSAGEHHIDGRVALEYWRTRYNIADGSDIERIARDQYLMAQIVKGVLHSGLLSSPTELYNVIGDVSRATTTDASDTQLLHIALSLRGISEQNVQFITAPWASYPYDPNEVEFAQPQADALFWAIAHDTGLPPASGGRHKNSASPSASASPSPSTSPSPSASASPAPVTIMVLDGSSKSDLTSSAELGLAGRGFAIAGTGYAPSQSYVDTVIEFGGAAGRPAARSLLKQFTMAKIKRVKSLGPATIDIILGRSFTALAPPQPTPQSSINSLDTSYGGINASVRCRNSAFYGIYDTPQPGKANTCAC